MLISKYVVVQGPHEEDSGTATAAKGQKKLFAQLHSIAFMLHMRLAPACSYVWCYQVLIMLTLLIAVFGLAHGRTYSISCHCYVSRDSTPPIHV